MGQQKPNEYLKVKIQTAKPTELLLLLFDGALRFTAQAKRHMEARELDRKNELFLRAQAIILELIQALDPKIGDELYRKLIELYRFCYDRLLRANLEDDPRAADEATKILEHLRETWQLAVDKFQEEGGTPLPARDRHALCLEG